jgi:N-acetylglucosamine kinase-like BadF-type ATPase
LEVGLLGNETTLPHLDPGMNYFVGGDIGGTKTHIVIADENGHLKGFGQSGGGNHESVGYDGFIQAVGEAFQEAMVSADISIDQITGAGLGIGGYDWESQRKEHLRAIASLGFKGPVEIVNDAILGLLAGSDSGWGIAVVSGTGCNCWGWNQDRKRVGRVTGLGTLMGEGAGASELIHRAVQMISYEWTRRGPVTALTPAFVRYAGAKDLEDLIEGYCMGRYDIGPAAAPLVFIAAETGDEVASSLVSWAATELGELVNGVVRQLEFQSLDFEVVMIGSMFQNGPSINQPMQDTIHKVAPGARLKKLTVPPVTGGLLLAMETAGYKPNTPTRMALLQSISQLKF